MEIKIRQTLTEEHVGISVVSHVCEDNLYTQTVPTNMLLTRIPGVVDILADKIENIAESQLARAHRLRCMYHNSENSYGTMYRLNSFDKHTFTPVQTLRLSQSIIMDTLLYNIS